MWENLVGAALFGAFCYGLYRYVQYRKANKAEGGSGGGFSRPKGDTKLK